MKLRVATDGSFKYAGPIGPRAGGAYVIEQDGTVLREKSLQFLPDPAEAAKVRHLFTGDTRMQAGVSSMTQDLVLTQRQFYAECAMAVKGIKRAISLGAAEIEFIYDYEGLGYFVIHDPRWGKPWKAKGEFAQRYVSEMRSIMEHVKLVFSWSRGHTGANPLNDAADILAQEAADGRVVDR